MTVEDVHAVDKAYVLGALLGDPAVERHPAVNPRVVAVRPIPGVLTGLGDEHLPKMEVGLLTVDGELSLALKDHMQMVAVSAGSIEIIIGQTVLDTAEHQVDVLGDALLVHQTTHLWGHIKPRLIIHNITLLSNS